MELCHRMISFIYQGLDIRYHLCMFQYYVTLAMWWIQPSRLYQIQLPTLHASPAPMPPTSQTTIQHMKLPASTAQLARVPG